MAVSVLTNVKNDVVNGIMTATVTAASSEGASSIFCGFKPRMVKMTQTAGTPDATSRSLGLSTMSAGYAVLVAAAGDLTIPTSNGFTFIDGTEVAPATKMTGSPLDAGPGVTVGTGVIANSIEYLIELYR